MQVIVIGGGPVGLVSGAVLASVGHRVHVVEIDATRADLIAQGKPPFHEAGLDAMLQDVVRRGSLSVSRSVASVAKLADAILICVGTPSNGDGADLTALRAASKELGEALRGRGRSRTPSGICGWCLTRRFSSPVKSGGRSSLRQRSVSSSTPPSTRHGTQVRLSRCAG